ncbi:MAG TPA: hypothetical protein VFK94_04375 [Patescibacteria group bacterium]|nr:hypothetical protein [Patescibacteria group bacterium]
MGLKENFSKKKTPPCGDVFRRSSETRKPGSVLDNHLSKLDVLKIQLPTLRLMLSS